jgi:hypothetical protein
MLRPHILSAALFAGCLVTTADVYGQQPGADRPTRRAENQAQRQENQAERQGNTDTNQQNRGNVTTESRNYRGDNAGSHSMEFQYDKVAQLKTKLLDSKLISQANQEYENQKDELAKKIACEIIVQVISEDRLFVASLNEKLMDEKRDEKVSMQEKRDMHQRIAAQKDMIMNDQEKLKDLLGMILMRSKVEEKLMNMMDGDEGDKDGRQARMEKDEDRN